MHQPVTTTALHITPAAQLLKPLLLLLCVNMVPFLLFVLLLSCLL